MTASNHKFIIEAGVDGTPHVKALGAAVDEVGDKTERFVKNSSVSLNNLLVLWAKITAALYSVKKAWDMAESAEKAKQEARAFENLAKSHEASADKIIRDLKRTSGGAIDTMTAIQKAGTAMMMGINPDALSRLMAIARATAQQTGQEVTKAFSDITLAVARQSNKILDNLGIIVKVEQANERYAATLGKSAQNLNDTERAQAFLNAALEAGEGLMKRLGDQTQTSAEKMQQFKAQLSEIKQFAGETLAPAFQPILDLINALSGLLPGGRTPLEDQIGVVERTLERYKSALQGYKNELSNLKGQTGFGFSWGASGSPMDAVFGASKDKIADLEKEIKKYETLVGVVERNLQRLNAVNRDGEDAIKAIAKALREENAALESSKVSEAVKKIADALFAEHYNAERLKEKLKELPKELKDIENAYDNLTKQAEEFGIAALATWGDEEKKREKAAQHLKEYKDLLTTGMQSEYELVWQMRQEVDAGIEQSVKSLNEKNLEEYEHFLDRVQDLFVDAFQNIREKGIESWEGLLSGMTGGWLDFIMEIGGQQIRDVLKGMISGESGGSFNFGLFGSRIATTTTYDPATGLPVTVAGQPGQPGLTGGQYAIGGLTAAAALYDVYQRSSGMSRTNAAISGGVTTGAAGGILGGMYGGAMTGVSSTSWSGYGAIVGAAVGLIIGGITGYLSGSDDLPKAKFQLGAGRQVGMAYPHAETPFGLFGFDQAKTFDTNQFKMTMAQVGTATEALADVMDSASVDRIRDALADWSSDTAKGDISAADFESKFKDYFKAIGATWGTEFGLWMVDFEGTLDDLFEGIMAHVDALKAVDEVFNPTSGYERAIQDVNDQFDGYIETLEKTGGSAAELARTEEARAKVLQETNEQFRKDIVDIGMQMLDFVGLLDPVDAAVYNINNQFADWIETLKDLGASSEELDAAMSLLPTAIDQATRAVANQIYTLQASLPGLTTQEGNQFRINQIAATYGIEPSMLTGDLANQLWGLAKTPGISMEGIQEWADQAFPGMNITPAQLYEDIGDLWTIFNPALAEASSAVQGFTNSMDYANQAISTLTGAIDSIDNLIFRMTGGDLAPVQSAAFFETNYAKLLGLAQLDPANAGALTSFIPQMLDFFSGTGQNALNLNTSILQDLTGLRGGYEQQRVDIHVHVAIDGREIGYAVAADALSNGELINRIGDIVETRISRQ
jgi:hypothetical protein